MACGVAKPGRPKKVEREFGIADLVGFGFLAAFFPPVLVDRGGRMASLHEWAERC